MPVLVDAAAEILTVPNVHLENGATLVGYSGGKCLRGPQSAGLLLGRKDLVQAAWVHSAPHHGFARAMKVGKEEAIGMLMAVEMWMKRDHKAEWSRGCRGSTTSRSRSPTIDGVTTSVTETTELSNRTPSLSIHGIRSGSASPARRVARHLMDTEPRIATPGGRDRDGQAQHLDHAVHDGGGRREDRRRADSRHALEPAEAGRARRERRRPPRTSAASGTCRSNTLASASTHTLHLKQVGNRIEGTHQGDFVSRDLSGTIDGNTRAALESVYRAARRRLELPLHRQRRRRRAWPARSTWAST